MVFKIIKNKTLITLPKRKLFYRLEGINLPRKYLHILQKELMKEVRKFQAEMTI